LIFGDNELPSDSEVVSEPDGGFESGRSFARPVFKSRSGGAVLTLANERCVRSVPFRPVFPRLRGRLPSQVPKHLYVGNTSLVLDGAEGLVPERFVELGDSRLGVNGLRAICLRPGRTRVPLASPIRRHRGPGTRGARRRARFSPSPRLSGGRVQFRRGRIRRGRRSVEPTRRGRRTRRLPRYPVPPRRRCGG